MQTDPAEIAAKLTKAQREAVLNGQMSEANGVWHPAGVYVSADKRVRYNLVRAGVIRDYVRRSNRLTPLGQQVAAILKENP